MATYTAKQYSAELDRRLRSFNQSKAVFGCVAETHRQQINRLFLQGKGGAGKLGVYSKAYAERKKKKGREYKFVNFNCTGRLETDFANSLEKRGDTYVTGVSNSENSNKVDWLTERYGKQAFMLTKQERLFFSDCVNNSLLDYLRGEK